MSDQLLLHKNKIYTRALNIEVVKWRPKTRASNQFGMNMKMVLNIGLKNDSLINAEESSSEEYSKSKKIEGIIAEALGNIEESLKNFPEFPIGGHMSKGKNVI